MRYLKISWEGNMGDPSAEKNEADALAEKEGERKHGDYRRRVEERERAWIEAIAAVRANAAIRGKVPPAIREASVARCLEALSKIVSQMLESPDKPGDLEERIKAHEEARR